MYRSEDHYERSCVLLAHVFTPSNNAEGGDGIWRADARFQPSYADVADSQEVQRIEKCPFEFLQGSFFNFQKQSPFVAQIRHEGNSSDLPLPSYPNLESLRDSIAPFSMSDKKNKKKWIYRRYFNILIIRNVLRFSYYHLRFIFTTYSVRLSSSKVFSYVLL